MTKLEKYKKLRILLKRWTRCEIMARHGDFKSLGFVDYALKEVEYRNRIRKLLYGTDDLLELGLQWKMLKPRKKGRR